MTETAAIRARRRDCSEPSLTPTCPRCGDLCEPTALRCECGAIVRDVPKRIRGPIPWKAVYVACACGCGATFTSTDRHKRPRRFKRGHNNKRPVSPAAKWWKQNHDAAEIAMLASEFA